LLGNAYSGLAEMVGGHAFTVATGGYEALASMRPEQRRIGGGL
jgi:hypothetical protein